MKRLLPVLLVSCIGTLSADVITTATCQVGTGMSVSNPSSCSINPANSQPSARAGMAVNQLTSIPEGGLSGPFMASLTGSASAIPLSNIGAGPNIASNAAAVGTVSYQLATIGPVRSGVLAFVGSYANWQVGPGNDSGQISAMLGSFSGSCTGIGPFCNGVLLSGAPAPHTIPFTLGTVFGFQLTETFKATGDPFVEGPGFAGGTALFSFQLFEADGATPVKLYAAPEPGTFGLLLMCLAAFGGLYMPKLRSHYFPAIFSVIAASMVTPALYAASDCGSLATAKLPNTEITVAQTVDSGTFTPPYGASLDKLPPFCRVAGVIRPTSDSYIRFEVWLPASGWNQKFLGVGNGGFAGSIDYNSLGRIVKSGYATAATDTGHEGEAEDASWAYQHPEKIADFGYRGLHLTVETAKAIIRSFYGRPQQHAYFDACSDGGREALMEAQRFPEDFDGILAGAPANYWTHMLTGGAEVAKQVYSNPAAYIPSIKVPAIRAATEAACDAQDGVKDGIINDPSRCRFDPSVLLCKGVETRSCLTAPQVASLKEFYAGGQDSHGQQIFPGFLPGAEEGPGGWRTWILGTSPGGSSGFHYMQNYFRYMVFNDPAWTPVKADIAVAEQTADEKTARVLNATDPDLRRFQARGGKLILYHGWNDPGISPLNTINYYNSVLAAMGAQSASGFVRLYMAPGMQHCISGPGPNWLGQLGTVTAKGPERGLYAALEQWVEAGTLPDTLIATKYVSDNPQKGVQMTRPLCPYPQVARYKGTGDTNNSDSFACANPDNSPVAQTSR